MQKANNPISQKNPSWSILAWIFLCFLLLSSINGGFSYLFDVVLFDLKIGYGYMYFAVFFFSIVLYFFYEKLQIKWLGTIVFGLMGLIGIPIEYWLEYLVTPALKSIWGAIGWGVIYILYGLVADLSMFLVKIMKKRKRAVFLSGLLFSAALLGLSIIPLNWFYNPIPADTNYLTYAWFLMPFGILQGSLGALLGHLLPNGKIGP
ncbi:MAG: hypothetical protein JW776_04270 [Candidatus Lokiarchaeota archaeon]|nr:hypothetical protein [Candidatus Lokiarchaeota archaeon]